MKSALDISSAQFVNHHPESERLFKEALKSLPGGNTRTLLHTSPFPVFMKKGEGCRLWDEDGNLYYDFVGELSAGLFGHSNSSIRKTLESTIRDIGLNLGATNVYEQRYASLLCERFGLGHVRFCNSGTEATLHCLGAARQFTGRRKIMVFRGAYHGSVFTFGAGIAPNNVDHDDWVLVQYNDPKGVKDAFVRHTGAIAAVIVEGLQGSGGCIPASMDFLNTIRSESSSQGSLMIMDEVMTSRLAVGGLKSALGITPDLCTLGKYLGGGMPFGGFGGRRDVMDVYSPLRGLLAHSGTFQNNTLMLCAGYTGLKEVYTNEAVQSLNAKGDILRHRLQKVFAGSKFCVTGRGSMLCIHATESGLLPDQIQCRDNVADVEAVDLKKLFWIEMVGSGFWVQVRGMITLNIAITEEVLDAFVEAVESFCRKYSDLIKT